MKSEKLEDYMGGWLVGDFFPALINSKDIEVSVRILQQYEYAGFFYRKRDTEVLVIIDGVILSDGKRYSQGDILIFSAGDMIDIFPITRSVCVEIKTPGGKIDKRYEVPIELKKIENICNYVYRDLGEVEDFKGDINSEVVKKEDVTILIQGPISNSFTKSGIESVRKYFPESPIILSTWEGSDLNGLDYDHVVISEDPGGLIVPFWNGDKLSNNTNRYIVSTLAGLNQVKTKYVLKLRSDMYILGDSFLKYFRKYPKRKKKFSLFKERIIVPEIYTRESLDYQCGREKHHIECPYHITDWAMFGLKEDVDLWLSHVPFSDKHNVLDKYTKTYRYPAGWDLPPEQFYFISALKTKFPDVRMTDIFDYTDETVKKAKEYTMNNFIILNSMQMKLFCGKYPHEFLINNGTHYAMSGLLKNSDFIEYYKKMSETE